MAGSSISAIGRAQPIAKLNWPQIELGLPLQASPRMSRGARHASVQPAAARRARPASFSARRPARTRLSGAAARRAGRAGARRHPRAAARSSPRRPTVRGRRSRRPSRRHARRRASCRAPQRRASTVARSSPVAAASSAAIEARSAVRNGRTRRVGRLRRRARAPRGSGTRSGPRSRVARRAAGRRRSRPGASVRQPAASAASIVTRVSSRPRPRRRQSGRTQTVPIQATGPWSSPRRSRRSRHRPRPRTGALSVPGRERHLEPPIAPVLDAGSRRRSARHRRASSVGSPAGASADRSGLVGYHRAHGHPVPLGRRARRASRAPRPDRGGADASRGQLNHILDQYAILAELPTDDIPPTAQTIELENILREDVVRPSLPVEAVLANAPATRRRLHRRAGDPRRALTRGHA